MSSELEQRLEGLFAGAPEPDPGAGEEALHKALRALQPAARPRRGMRTLVVVFAAALVLLVIAAGSLAAAGALHVRIGSKAAPHPQTIPLSLPRGANGIAAIVDGRLSVVTKSGFRLQGLPVSAAALSPHALYVAAGIGHSLVALKPDGGQAWSRPTRGKVVDIAWAPDGLRIAYIVADKGGHRWRLDVIWGNGTHDEVIDRLVSPTLPSWRADSLALAYDARQPTRGRPARAGRGARGPLFVYDLTRPARTVRLRARQGAVARLAFAPNGSELAVDQLHRTLLLGRQRRMVWKGATHGIGWLDGRLAVAAAVPDLHGRRIEAFATHDHLLAAVVPGPEGTLRILAGRIGHLRTVFQAKARCGDHSATPKCASAFAENGVELG